MRVNGELAAQVSHATTDSALDLFVAGRFVFQRGQHFQNHLADLLELRSAKTARRTCRRAEANARRDWRVLRVERNAVLVASDAGPLKRLLGLRTRQPLRAQIDEQQMVV